MSNIRRLTLLSEVSSEENKASPFIKFFKISHHHHSDYTYLCLDLGPFVTSTLPCSVIKPHKKPHIFYTASGSKLNLQRYFFTDAFHLHGEIMLLPKAKPEFELAPLLCRDRARASDAAFIAVKVVNQAKELTFFALCF